MGRRACEPHRPSRREEGKVFLLFLTPGLGSSERNLSLLSGEAESTNHTWIFTGISMLRQLPLLSGA